MFATVLVLSVVVSARCVQQKSNQLSNQFANRNADRSTSNNPWRVSQHSRPGQPWTSSEVTTRWQHLPSVNRLTESTNNYRWNTQNNDWKPNMMFTSSKWRRNLAFGGNKFNNQEMNGRRIKYWTNGSNKGTDLFKDPMRYKAQMPNIFVFDQTRAMNYEPRGNICYKMVENQPAMFNKAVWAASNKPLIMPYAVPEGLIVPVLNPMQIRVPIVHNLPYTIEKSVPFPPISEVPQYHKLVPMSAKVPHMVPYEVHLYPNGRKWRMQTKY